MRFAMIAGFALGLTGALAAYAQDREEVRFAPGDYGTMIEGTVTGNAYRDYTLDLGEGQRLFAEIAGGSTVYFNVMPPGADWTALFVGSMDGDVADLTLPESGTYTMRVYQMGNAADSGQTTPFALDLSVQ